MSYAISFIVFFWGGQQLEVENYAILENEQDCLSYIDGNLYKEIKLVSSDAPIILGYIAKCEPYIEA